MRRERLITHLIGLAVLLTMVWIWTTRFPHALASIQTALRATEDTLIASWHRLMPTSDSFFDDPERLRERFARLAQTAVEVESLREENANLKTQLDFFERQSYAHVTAHVLTRSVSPLSEVFVIDRGSNDGVTFGSPAIVYDGVIVGKVSEVRASTATIRALTDRRSRVAASVLRASQTIGVAEGTAGSLLTLRFIPQDASLQVDDLLVTSGLEVGVPPGLVIGIVNRVTSNSTSPFQEAYVEPIGNSEMVTVLSVMTAAVPTL
jgi:rod shape-determining protein MreC